MPRVVIAGVAIAVLSTSRGTIASLMYVQQGGRAAPRAASGALAVSS